MPNLKPWIEAQLKKGYTKQQIKRVLSRRGYPKTAVAHVDKAKSSTSPSEKIPKKSPSKPLAVIVTFIVILILLGLFGLLPFSLEESSIEQPAQEKVDPLIDEEETKEKSSSLEICQPFTSPENEISCEDAVETALEQYPGEVYSVDKTLMIPAPVGPNPTEKFWSIGINLDTPLESELPPETNDIERELFSEITVDTNKIYLFISLSTGVIEATRFG